MHFMSTWLSILILNFQTYVRLGIVMPGKLPMLLLGKQSNDRLGEPYSNATHNSREEP